MMRRKEIANTIAFWSARLVMTLLVIVFSADAASGQPSFFVEDFTGPGLDPAWTQGGDPAGHPATIAGTYDITDAHGLPGTNLNRSTGGTVSSFTHEIDVVLDPNLLTGSSGTLSDFKFGDAVPDQTVVAIDNWSLTTGSSGTPGDFDADADVDGSDFLMWQRGDSPLSGTPDELVEWQTNYPGAPGPLVAATAAVPEPSGILLVLTSAAITNLSRRFRQTN